MSGYLTPYENAESEFTEKRSRFIGEIRRVDSEAEARAAIEETKKKYHDARHHCWGYLLHTGSVARYSDDGEPQGTAGQPILNVFQRQGVMNACCIVTRYFGGILLGAGGLTRAYRRSAADTLHAAGVCHVRLWTRWKIPCTYPLFERIKAEIASCGGSIQNVEYGVGITVSAAFLNDGARQFAPRLTELSSGKLSMSPEGQVYLPGPREDAR